IAKRRLAGIVLYPTAPTCSFRKSQCFVIENSCGTLSVVHNLYAEPGVSPSVVRMTTCPEKGSSLAMYVNAKSRQSFGTFHATNAPGARLVDISVCLTRRM